MTFIRLNLNDPSPVAGEVSGLCSVMSKPLNHKKRKSLKRAIRHRQEECDRFFEVNRYVSVESDGEAERRQEVYRREQQLQTPPPRVNREAPEHHRTVEAPHQRIVRLRSPSPPRRSKRRVIEVGPQVSSKFIVLDQVGETDD